MALSEEHVKWMQRFFVVAGTFGSYMTYKLYKENEKKPNKWYLLLPFTCFSLHQCEEYVLSSLILGEKFHFREWAYRQGMIITPKVVLKMNFVIPWAFYSLQYLTRNKPKLSMPLTLFLSSLLAANAAFHYGPNVITAEFSPGVITGLLLYNTLQFFFAKKCIDDTLLSFPQVIGIVTGGWLYHGYAVGGGGVKNQSPNHYQTRLKNNEIKPYAI